MEQQPTGDDTNKSEGVPKSWGPLNEQEIRQRENKNIIQESREDVVYTDKDNEDIQIENETNQILQEIQQKLEKKYSTEEFNTKEFLLNFIGDGEQSEKVLARLAELNLKIDAGVDVKNIIDNMENSVSSQDEPQLKQGVEETNLNEKFNLLLKGKFHMIPPGSNFYSQLENVKEILVGSQSDSPEDSHGYITIFYNSTNKHGDVVEKHFSVPLARPGYDLKELVVERVPKEINNLSYNDVLTEVLGYLERTKSTNNYQLGEFAVEIDSDITPPGPGVNKETGEEGQIERAVIDVQRFESFVNNPDWIATLVPKILTRVRYGGSGKYGPEKTTGKLSEYHIFLYPGGAVHECAVCENVTIIYKFKERISEDLIQKIRNKEISQADFEKLLQERGVLNNIKIKKNKEELRKEGAYMKMHPPYHGSDMEKNNPEEFAKRWGNYKKEINAQLATIT